MADFKNNQFQTGRTSERAGVEYDAGLRSYMMRVYNYMSIGLALTGLVAMGTAALAQSNPAVANLLYNTPLKWVIMFAPLGFIFFLGAKMHTMSASTAKMTFWAFATIMGISMSAIFLVFTGASIAQTFFVTAAAFGGLSLYGYTTKRNLSGMGSFLVMGVIGLIIASVVNIFLASSALHFAISAIGVLIFAGLTAYDTQKIKGMYDQVAGNEELMGRTAIMGALSLYLDFVNMFQFLLSFLGNRE
ncbi:MAG: Bax inhibitor-1/YccA family protein [Nitratireductor sp.]